MKIVTIIGARPQFIKSAPVSHAIAEHNRLTPHPFPLTEVIVHTGQHFDADMSDVFFKELDIPRPDYNLGINSTSHGAMTGRMLEKIEEILINENPDWVLVYGDTNSTLAGALAASKLHIPIAHVEAGLRSFNRAMPEEINRVIADQLSSLLLCPSQTAVDNLAREGITSDVHMAGDVMYDALLMAVERAREQSNILERFGLEEKSFLLATVHRAENTDDTNRLGKIMGVTQNSRVVHTLHERPCPS